MNKKLLINNSRRRERGSALAYTVLSALFLFFAIGLGVDLSHLYLAKTELQNAADAGALAGASALTLPFDDPGRIPTAVNRALGVLNQNNYNFNNREFEGTQTLEEQRDLVQFAVNLGGPYINEAAAIATPENIRFIQVRTPGVPITTFFAIPILGAERILDAVAVAGLSVPGNANFCPAPLAIVDCGPEGCPEGQNMGGVCNPGGPMPNPDGTPCDPLVQFCRNCVYTIRAGPSAGPAPGNYHGLCCPGVDCDAEWVRLALAGTGNCNECPPVSPGEEVTPTTKPGITEGPIRQGINTRFDEYAAELNPTDHPPDPNIHSGTNVSGTLSGITWDQYQESDPFQAPGNPPYENRRILIFPMTPYSSWNDANGRDTVTVTSLGAFFLQKKVETGPSGAIKAEYIGDEVISRVGYDPNNNQTSNVVTPVLYR